MQREDTTGKGMIRPRVGVGGGLETPGTVPSHSPVPAIARRTLFASLSLLLAGPAWGQAPSGMDRDLARELARIAAIEDARGKHGAPVTDLVPPTASRSLVVRSAAFRALGRQQSPALLPHIYPGLRHPTASVRLAAVDGAGQAAQGLRSASAGTANATIALLTDSLRASAMGTRRTPATAGLVSRTIGRLPYRDSASARRAESLILEVARPSGRPAAWTAVPAPIVEGMLHGLYAIARQRRALGAPSLQAIAAMRATVAYRGQGGAGPNEAAARIRRLAVLGIAAAGAVDTFVVRRALADDDEQVRRLAVVAQAGLPDSGVRRAVIRRALDDGSALVRLEAIRGARAFAAVDGCAPMLAAAADANAHVALAAIDGLGNACRDRDQVAEALLGLIDANRSDSPVRAPGRSGWHVHAHALVALARTSPERAAGVVRRDARESALWTVRTYAARAARQLRDTATLGLLASDRDGNVRQEALGGLAATVGHAADRQYVDALRSTGYHVVMEAAQALRGAPSPGSVVPALLESLDRITAERRETSRDARMALLDRLDELGTAGDASRLDPYTTDFDSTVARRAASLLARWRGREHPAAPSPLPARQEEILPLMAGTWRARVTMSPATGGGSFEVALYPREAPYTVARFARLARSGYYNGLTFHRVEPGFVIQGGSPAATEYVGDGPFMRDELGPRSHTRGTLGISTRGRDTGDAQIFVNLIDNFRLDHDYTVFGEIVRGRDVAERVLEADVIERVDIVRVR